MVNLRNWLSAIAILLSHPLCGWGAPTCDPPKSITDYLNSGEPSWRTAKAARSLEERLLQLPISESRECRGSEAFLALELCGKFLNFVQGTGYVGVNEAYSIDTGELHYVFFFGDTQRIAAKCADGTFGYTDPDFGTRIDEAPYSLGACSALAKFACRKDLMWQSNLSTNRLKDFAVSRDTEGLGKYLKDNLKLVAKPETEQ